MTTAGPAPVPAHRSGWIAPVLLALAVAGAYANARHGILVLDDFVTVRDNATIRHLATALFPRGGGATVSGRPLLNLTFALDYARSGDSPAAFHVTNLVIHLLSALAFYGVVRRGLAFVRPPPGAAGPAGRDLFAFSAALLWALHPLQTEAVTYIAQRAESLAGLLFLATFYAFLRGVAPGASPRWLDASIGAAVLGALAKETIVTAAPVILFFDALFVGGSISAAWARRRAYYAGLALSWLVVFWQLVGSGGRGGTAGFDTSVGWFDYALKQVVAVTHYLRLALWPSPLVLDYGTDTTVAPAALATGIAVLGALAAATVLAFRRRPGRAFLGTAFFLLLAPTSSVVPVATQVMAEHRMYLPLAAVVLAFVSAVFSLAGRWAPAVTVALAVACGAVTVQRNRDYQSAVVLWTQALAASDDFRARLNLGEALANAGRPEEAIVQYRAALGFWPRSAPVENNWANALVDLGRPEEALAHFAAALRDDPGYAEAHFNCANTLMRLGRTADAVAQYRLATGRGADHAIVHYNLANALAQLGHLPEAVAEYRAALRLEPEFPGAHLRLGNALFASGRPADSIPEYTRALARDPADAEAARNLAAARAATANPTH